MALTRADQAEAAKLLRRVLDAVQGGGLAADGPAAVAVVRRLEGALMALDALGQPANRAGSSSAGS